MMQKVRKMVKNTNAFLRIFLSNLGPSRHPVRYCGIDWYADFFYRYIKVVIFIIQEVALSFLYPSQDGLYEKTN